MTYQALSATEVRMTSPAREQGHLCLNHVPGEARMKEVAERAAGEKERIVSMDNN